MVSRSELLQGDRRKALTIKDDLKAVTPQDINKRVQQYIGNFTWVYQGGPAKVNQVLYTQKETPKLPEKQPALKKKRLLRGAFFVVYFYTNFNQPACHCI